MTKYLVNLSLEYVPAPDLFGKEVEQACPTANTTTPSTVHTLPTAGPRNIRQIKAVEPPWLL